MIRSRSPKRIVRLEIKIGVVAGMLSRARRVKKFDGIHLDANRQWWVRHRMVVHGEHYWGDAHYRAIRPLLAKFRI